MSSPAITALVSRYEHDEVAQLLLVVEQLELARELVCSDGLPAVRAGLILLDHHAEILLMRHAEACFRSGEGMGPARGRFYSTAERKAIGARFPAKLELASGEGPLGTGVPALLGADRVAVLRIAHSARNAAYHRDEHNPKVLRLFALLQFEAVCQLLAATTSGLMVSVGEDSELLELQRFGVQPGAVGGLRHGVKLDDAAEAVAKALMDGIELPLEPVQHLLALDVLERAERAAGVVGELLAEGMEAERLTFALSHSEFWAKHGSDEEMDRLLKRSSHWERRAERSPAGGFPAAVEEDMRAANAERNARFLRLRRRFRPTARLEAISEVIGEGTALTHEPTLAATLERYAAADRKLKPLDRFLPEVVRGWEGFVQGQIDFARGK